MSGSRARRTKKPRKTKSDLGLVGTSRDEDDLLEAVRSAARSLDEAIDEHALVRTKITGRWIYAASKSALDAAQAEVESAALGLMQGWLIGAAPYLRHPIANASKSPRITYRAVELLLRELVRDRRLRGMPLLTNAYEPYLGLYAPADEDEIAAQVDGLKAVLRKHGRVRPRDLPSPLREREAGAWRSLVLRHGEFLGLGRLDNGVLIAWDADGAS